MYRLVLPVLILLLLPVTARTQEVSLRFDPVTPVKGTSVKFTASGRGSVSAEALAGLNLRTEETQEHLYSLSVDMGTFARNKYRFAFQAYVQSLHPHGGTTIQNYTVSEDPTGSFPDGGSQVTFHVTGNAGEDGGTIKLPIHSDDGSNNLRLEIPKDPRKVSMGGPSTLELGLTNDLDSLHVSINQTSVKSTSCDNCWLLTTASPNLNELAPQKGTSLIVSLRPNTIKAFLTTVWMLKPDTPHDTLLISIASTSEQGGLVSPQEFRIPVRFSPPALYLLVVVLVGALAGGILHMWLIDTPAPLAGRGGHVQLLNEIGKPVAMALVVWFVALILYSSTATQVTVFGFALDPSQVPPAGLIALLAAGGPPVIAWIKKVLGL